MVPSGLTLTVPLAGPLPGSTETVAGPSPWSSFPRTSIVTGVSSSVLTVSGTASGAKSDVPTNLLLPLRLVLPGIMLLLTLVRRTPKSWFSNRSKVRSTESWERINVVD